MLTGQNMKTEGEGDRRRWRGRGGEQEREWGGEEGWGVGGGGWGVGETDLPTNSLLFCKFNHNVSVSGLDWSEKHQFDASSYDSCNTCWTLLSGARTQNITQTESFFCFLGCLSSQQHAKLISKDGLVYTILRWSRIVCSRSHTLKYWRQATKTYDRPHNPKVPLECPFLSHWYDNLGWNQGLPHLRPTPGASCMKTYLGVADN